METLDKVCYTAHFTSVNPSHFGYDLASPTFSDIASLRRKRARFLTIGCRILDWANSQNADKLDVLWPIWSYFVELAWWIPETHIRLVLIVPLFSAYVSTLCGIYRRHNRWSYSVSAQVKTVRRNSKNNVQSLIQDSSWVLRFSV